MTSGSEQPLGGRAEAEAASYETLVSAIERGYADTAAAQMAALTR